MFKGVGDAPVAINALSYLMRSPEPSVMTLDSVSNAETILDNFRSIASSWHVFASKTKRGAVVLSV